MKLCRLSKYLKNIYNYVLYNINVFSDLEIIGQAKYFRSKMSNKLIIYHYYKSIYFNIYWGIQYSNI